ncbi:carboxypeptidase-like regulatory domain-containing protein [Algoriphagus sp.]|uniref:carboxypeptidase-like regulatory domain-containing protein n=1 Tax=Algoriphagus sp. TaxID=1872435 RepID=UPI003275661D
MTKANVLRTFLFLGILFSYCIDQEVLAQKQPKPPTTPVVRGQIIDKDSAPIPGAAILVDGTTKGVASDLNGFFELDLSLFTEKKVTLIIRYVGTEVKKVDVSMKDLPKSFGQIKLNDIVK